MGSKKENGAKNRNGAHESEGGPCGIAAPLGRDLVEKPLGSHEDKGNNTQGVPIQRHVVLTESGGTRKTSLTSPPGSDTFCPLP